MLQPRTIRIFISSTFKDMHSERDYLVRFVFPELREKCIRKGLSLVDVDLRWGVSQEEAEQGKAIEICLDEIENCRPFFIGILGERYGWTPDSYQVPDYQKFDWLSTFEKGHSVTALEIYHGVLNRKEMRPRAFFYFRNPCFVKNIPEAKKADVLVESPESANKLFHLKKDIIDIFNDFEIPGHITENYSCDYKGLKIDWQSVKTAAGDILNTKDIAILEEVAGIDSIIDNEEYARLNAKQQKIVNAYSHVYLKGLEEFGNVVLTDLLKAIDEEYPDDQTETNPELIEQAYHIRFMDSRTRMFIGREEILEKLLAYLNDYELHKPIILTGEPGSGKSAILAVAAKRNMSAIQNGFSIIRFIGASPDSLDINNLVTGIIREIAFDYELLVDETRVEDPTKLYEYFRELLFTVGRISNLTLFIDALNQLYPASDPHYLAWLPKYLPGNVKIILSSLEGDFTINAIKYEVPFLTVEKLSTEKSSEILQITFAEYRKSLSKSQIESILAKADAKKPLYLKVASEELRVFSNFELINARIEHLPETIPDLFAQLLERLETDHHPELVKNTMCLLECSMYGLLESELLELLKPDDKEKLPLNTWARLYRNLAPYLLNAGNNNEGLFDFFHLQLSLAVRARYLNIVETEKYYYKRLADYGLRKYNLKNGDTTNTILYTSIYLYKATEEDILYSLLNDIFTSANNNYEAYERIASELYNWTIETYNYDVENILKKLTKKMTNIDKSHLFALFLNEKGQSHEETGNIKWALDFFENSLIIMSDLVLLQKDNLDMQKDLSECFSNVGCVYSKTGEFKKSFEYFNNQNKILKELVIIEPQRTDFKIDLSESYKNLGDFFSSVGEGKKALSFFEKDLKVMEELIALEPNSSDFKRDLSVSFKNLGDFFSSVGEGEKAQSFFEKDLKVMEELIASEPNRTDFKRDLSVSFKNLGEFFSSVGEGEKAQSYFEKDLKVMEELIALEPNRTDFKRDLSVSYKNLGVFNSSIGNGKNALFYFKNDLMLMEDLIDMEPYRTDFKRDLSVSFKNLGDFYSSIGERTKALSFLEKDLQIMEELVKNEPVRMDFKRDLSLSFCNIGNFYSEMGEAKKALRFYEKDLHVMEELIALEPNRTDFKSDISVSYKNIGNFYSEIGDGKKALRFFKKDLKLMKELIALEPNRTDFKRDLSVSFFNIANFYSGIGDEKKALLFFKKDLKVMKDLIALEPNRTDFKRDLSVSYCNIGNTYSNLGNKHKALHLFENQHSILKELVELESGQLDFKREFSVSFSNLGKVYFDMGNKLKAIELFEKDIQLIQELVEIAPERTDFRWDLSISFRNFGKIYSELKKEQKALKFFKKQKNTLQELVAIDPGRLDFQIDYADSLLNIFNVCPDAEKMHWLKKAKCILEPMINNKHINKQLQELWKKVNGVDPLVH